MGTRRIERGHLSLALRLLMGGIELSGIRIKVRIQGRLAIGRIELRITCGFGINLGRKLSGKVRLRGERRHILSDAIGHA